MRHSKCGLVFLYPFPSENEVSKLYTGSYNVYHDKDDNSSFRGEIRRMIERILVNRKKPIMRLKSTGKILDIGCGTGDFLDEMQKNNWDVYGIEISEYASRQAAFKCGKEKVLTGKLNQSHFSANHFDVITCWHVLEHTIDINNLVKETFRLLKEDGIFVIEVPNLDSLVLRITKENYCDFIYNVPEHVIYWSKKSLTNLLNRHGFKVEKIEYPFHALLNLSKSISDLTTNNLCSKIIYWTSIPISIISAIWGTITGSGDIIRVYAKKSNSTHNKGIDSLLRYTLAARGCNNAERKYREVNNRRKNEVVLGGFKKEQW